MQVILLDEIRFDNFAINHPQYNFFQTSNYGKLMTKHGHNCYYMGLVDDIGNIKAATLLVVKNEKNNKRKMAYAPRGFLIDWNDEELVVQFTNLLKDFLAKRNFTYIKIDPCIVYKEHDTNGNEKFDGESNSSFVKKMQSLGYIHMGYNNGLEAIKPRWNAITKLNNNIITLYNSISKEARNNIKIALAAGNRVYKGNINDIELFFNTIGKEKPPLDYYLDFYQFFGQNNGFELYFSKLEPVTYVNASKNLYEKEEQRNNELNNQIQDWNIPNKDRIINEKLNSDSLLASYKKNMLEAINLFQQYPNGIITAGLAVIKYGKKITFFAEGEKNDFKDKCPLYLLKWQLIQEFATKGYEIVEYEGITSDLKLNKEKIDLANKLVEYVGEFDLVINKKSYYTGSKLDPILNWLNTPI